MTRRLALFVDRREAGRRPVPPEYGIGAIAEGGFRIIRRNEVEVRTAILVDDGIATGGTTVVTPRAPRARGAAKVVLAVPVRPTGKGGSC